MAARGQICHKNDENLTLHEMFHIVGDQMTDRDVSVLKFLYNGIIGEQYITQINDGFSFLMALEKIGRVDSTNFKHILNMLRIITRHDLLQFVSLRRRKIVDVDPVTKYLEETSATKVLYPDWKKARCNVAHKGCDTSTDRPTSASENSDSVNDNVVPTSSAETSTKVGSPSETGSKCPSSSVPLSVSQSPTDGNPSSLQKRKRRKVSSCWGRIKRRKQAKSDVSTSPSGAETVTTESCEISPVNTTTTTTTSVSNNNISGLDEAQPSTSFVTNPSEIKPKVTCDIRLRVRAEYCQHDAALEGNIFSNKPELIERQFEKFMQANTILKSRDLGSIICDIKFSELTYLDAFWRDYINGSLLEALKGVFITESLKQAVGHEAIKLLVSVDEDDYDKGRLTLLQNLTD